MNFIPIDNIDNKVGKSDALVRMPNQQTIDNKVGKSNTLVRTLFAMINQQTNKS
jgi:hypothetical protein